MAQATVEVQELMRRWEAMRPRVVGSLCARGWSEEDAQDLFGESVLRAVGRVDSLHDPEAAEGWFWSLVNRHAIDERRRRARRPRRRDEVNLDDLAAVPPEEHCRCSLEMLKDLPESYRAVLESVDVDGQEVKDFAIQASITANNASVRLYRARRALREKLEETCQTTSVAECLSCGC